MDTVHIVPAIAIFLALPPLCAGVFYTVKYMRLRRRRKDKLADYLHDFFGSWTRLMTRNDPPEEMYYLKRMLFSVALFMAYTSLLVSVGHAISH